MKAVKVILTLIWDLIFAVMFVSILFLKWSGYSEGLVFLPSFVLFPIFMSLCVSLIAIDEIEEEQEKRRRRKRRSR
ncbi:MAG: hypothetical protein J6Y02_01345 [Pseudobutyrivibrio sp.]|nr:hypothetical protein [Pseudobutyrivibrio sp.]